MASRKSTESGHGKEVDFRASAARLAWGLSISLALHAGVAAMGFTGWKILEESMDTGTADRPPVPFHILNREPAPTPPDTAPEPPPKVSTEAPGKPREARRRTPRTPVSNPRPGERAKDPAPRSVGGTPGIPRAATDPPASTAAVSPTQVASTSPARAAPDPMVEARRSYALMLRKAIRDAGRYPPVARRRRLEGQAVLGIRVESGGRVARVRLVESSSHGVLDQTALAWGRGLGTLPPPPGGAMDVIVPVDFSLK